MNSELLRAAQALMIDAAKSATRKAAIRKTVTSSKEPLAHDSILDLPQELLELIADDLSINDILALRTCAKTLALLLDRALFDRAEFHVVIDKDHLPGFEDLVTSSCADKIKNLKILDRHLLLSRYKLTSIDTLGGSAHTSEHEISDGPIKVLDKATINASVTPDEPTLNSFFNLFQKLTNVSSIKTSVTYILAEYWKPHSVGPPVFHRVTDINPIATTVTETGQSQSSLQGIGSAVLMWSSLTLLLHSQNPLSFARLSVLDLQIPRRCYRANVQLNRLASWIVGSVDLRRLKLSADYDGYNFREMNEFLRCIAYPKGGMPLKQLECLELSRVSQGECQLRCLLAIMIPNMRTLRQIANDDGRRTHNKQTAKAFLATLLQMPRLESIRLPMFNQYLAAHGRQEVDRVLRWGLSRINACRSWPVGHFDDDPTGQFEVDEETKRIIDEIELEQKLDGWSETAENEDDVDDDDVDEDDVDEDDVDQADVGKEEGGQLDVDGGIEYDDEGNYFGER